MSLTTDENRKIIESFAKIQQRAAELAGQYIMLDDKVLYSIEPNDVSVAGGDLFATYSVYAYDEWEDQMIIIPIEWLELSDEEAHRAMVRHIDERNKKAAQVAAEQEAIMAQVREQEDFEEYIKLKARFEKE